MMALAIDALGWDVDDLAVIAGEESALVSRIDELISWPRTGWSSRISAMCVHLRSGTRLLKADSRDDGGRRASTTARILHAM